MKVLLTIFLMFVFVTPTLTQGAHDKNQKCRDRAIAIVNRLEKGNPLRDLVEHGYNGDCKRFEWMDKMQEFGIKQASYLVEYKWKNESVSFVIKSTTYLQTYYTNFNVYAIKNKILLRRITESGLDRALKNVVMTSVQKSGYTKRGRDTVSKDVFQVDLFDHESLPISYMIF